MTELVKYKNEMNTVPMRNFNAVELDLFFAICSQVKEKQGELVVFSYDQLRELSQYKPTANKRFEADVDRVYTKLLGLSFARIANGKKGRSVIFTDYDMDENERTVELRVNPRFRHLLNNLDVGNFTRFELDEFTGLRSSYSKQMYRLLKQWRIKGEVVYTIEQLRELLDIPQSYAFKDITRKVLKPIETELSKFFRLFEIEKIKDKKNKKTIVALKFSFAREESIPEKKFKFIGENETNVHPVSNIPSYNWLEEDDNEAANLNSFWGSVDQGEQE